MPLHLKGRRVMAAGGGEDWNPVDPPDETLTGTPGLPGARGGAQEPIPDPSGIGPVTVPPGYFNNPAPQPTPWHAYNPNTAPRMDLGNPPLPGSSLWNWFRNLPWANGMQYAPEQGDPGASGGEGWDPPTGGAAVEGGITVHGRPITRPVARPAAVSHSPSIRPGDGGPLSPQQYFQQTFGGLRGTGYLPPNQHAHDIMQMDAIMNRSNLTTMVPGFRGTGDEGHTIFDRGQFHQLNPEDTAAALLGHTPWSQKRARLNDYLALPAPPVYPGEDEYIPAPVGPMGR